MPLNPVAGVKVISPVVGLSVTVPCAGLVVGALIVSWALVLSTSLSLLFTLTVTAVPIGVKAESSTAIGPSFVPITVMVSVVVLDTKPLGSLMV